MAETYVIWSKWTESAIIEPEKVTASLEEAVEYAKHGIEASEPFDEATDDYFIEKLDRHFETLEEFEEYNENYDRDCDEVIPSIVQYWKETDPEGYRKMLAEKEERRQKQYDRFMTWYKHENE